MDLSLNAKRNAVRAAKAAGRDPAVAFFTLEEATPYWEGIPLNNCIFHRQVGEWMITVAPTVERKQIHSLLQKPADLSQCTQTDVLFFVLGLVNASARSSVFNMQTEVLFSKILSMSPKQYCGIREVGKDVEVNTELARLVHENGVLLSPGQIRQHYDELVPPPEKQLVFSSHEFSRNRTRGEQDAGSALWRDRQGNVHTLPALRGTKLKDVTVDQFNSAKEEYAKKLAKPVRRQTPADSTSKNSTRSDSARWILTWVLHEPTAGENNWKLHIQVHAESNPSRRVSVLRCQELETTSRTSHRLTSATSADRSRGSIVNEMREHATRVASNVSDVAQFCIRGGNTFFIDVILFDVAAAERFIREWSTCLREIGHEIIIPASLDGVSPKRGIVIRRKPVDALGSSGLFNSTNLLRFRWEIVLNDETIDVAELESLAAEKRALVKFRGKWIFFEPEKCSAERLAEIAERIRERPVESLSPLETLRATLSSYAEWHGIPLETDLGEFSKTDWFQRLSGQSPYADVGLPSGLALGLRLYTYQQRGLNWLAFLSSNGLGALLADDMGLGKTMQTLAWLQHRKNLGCSKPCLLVCPMSVMDNWESQARKYTPMISLRRHHGSQRPRTDVGIFSQSRGRDLVITTYGTLKSDIESLSKVEWEAVILDESQHIKTPETAVSRAARQVGKGADFRLALTGTPIENRVLDMWSQFDFLNPGLLGSEAEFKRDFAPLLDAKRSSSGETSLEKATESLKRLTSPFILRRMKSDPAIAPDLPAKIETEEWCYLTEEQAELYRATLLNLETELKAATGIKRSAAILSVLTKLKQICNHPSQALKDRSPLGDRSGKLNRLVEMLQDHVLQHDYKALIFTQYAEMGRLLEDFLLDRLNVGTQFLSGEDSTISRQNKVKQFQDDPRYPLFILTHKAGGVGLNLQAGNYVFHFDRWWNPAVEDQATDRSYRIGQEKTVFVYKFICKGTVEERIDELIHGKRDLANRIVGSTSEDSLAKQVAEMSNDELQSFFGLRTDALSED